MNKEQSGLPVAQHSENVPLAQEHTSATNEQSVQLTDNVHHQSAASEERHQEPKELENEREEEAESYVQHTPKINCPEKIVLCFDLSSEMNEVISRQNQKDRTVFEQLKKSVEIFAKHKLRFNKKHKMAILTFEKEALWVQDFSNDLHLISDTIDNIRPNQEFSLPQFDMASLLETIENHVELPQVPNEVDIPPEYVVRIILIYGRSHSEIPTLSREARRIFDRFTSCRLFFFDVLYIHQIPGGDNKCEEIYEALCKLDETEECFVLEVSTYAAVRLHDCTARLLAHPLQRPRQQDIEYRIVKSDVESSDEESQS
ncbi:BRISC and BRCA1-A complex member 1-like [Dendronephthya gigantea]|uniref:BRISC and BRCA1-A complex member 1-like n=1 Tax=Dendronephthya gigantea TaxID=151771 RepID=UPI00106CD6CC|nr:BRISC and BRCA1-A complex member 1-like [Dendronephthya gigantea]